MALRLVAAAIFGSTQRDEEAGDGVEREREAAPLHPARVQRRLRVHGAEHVTRGGGDEEQPHAEQAEPGEQLHDGELPHRGGHLPDGTSPTSPNSAHRVRGARVAHRSNSSMSSGGHSDVVTTVQSTASRNTTAPTWNEYFTVSGIPLAVFPATPSLLSTNGSAFAKLAPRPMNSDCITKPAVRCEVFSLSATNARNGSIETLIDASSTHSRLAAIQSVVDVGMMNSAIDAKIAPTRKYGPAAAEPTPRSVAQRTDDRLHEQAGHRGGEPEQRHLVGTGAEPLVDGRHVGELQPPAELDAEEAVAHVEQLPEAQPRSHHRGIHEVTLRSRIGVVHRDDRFVRPRRAAGASAHRHYLAAGRRVL